MISEGPSLSLLVVSWNTKALLARCLDSIERELRGVDYQIVVVDNSSCDGSKEMLADRAKVDSRLNVIENSENRGFAEANNQAFAAATGEYVVLLNSDAWLADDSLQRLVRYLETHPRVGAVSCNLAGPDGRSQDIHRSLPSVSTVLFLHTHIGRFIDHRLLHSRHHRKHRLCDLRREGVEVVGQAAAALLVMRASVVNEIGGLMDARYPILGNDVDLCRRIWDHGLEVHVLYDLTVLHEGSASLSQLSGEDIQHLSATWLHTYFEVHEPRWKSFVVRCLVPRARHLSST